MVSAKSLQWCIPVVDVTHKVSTPPYWLSHHFLNEVYRYPVSTTLPRTDSHTLSVLLWLRSMARDQKPFATSPLVSTCTNTLSKELNHHHGIACTRRQT